MNLVRLANNDGLEFHICEETKIAYASVSATARMLRINLDTLSRALSRGTVKGVDRSTLLSAEILTPGGLQGVALINSSQVFKLAIKYNPELAEKMGAAGANLFMLGLAGYQVSVQQFDVPQTFAQALMLAAKQQEAIELQQSQIKLLEEVTERQSEAIDELFNYSSIIRVAKFNDCSEKAFSWHKLKAASLALDLEIKKVDCPRFGVKNLYDHQAWRLAYPEYRLPETTTLRIG